MQLWRLYRKAHGPGLDGRGGLHAAGRWHEIGNPVVYFGATPAIAVLEKLAHVDIAFLPDDLVLACYEADLGEEHLPPQPAAQLHDLAFTRQKGVAFLQRAANSVLRVPSVVLPEESNLLLNPLHPEAQRLHLKAKRPFRFDPRLTEANTARSMASTTSRSPRPR
jgi:RES domain-containing protein